MDDGPAGSIMLYVLLVIGSAYFAGTEISLASVNRIHMMSLADKGTKGAQRVLDILDRFEEALSVLLIGNNIMHIGCATLSVIIATEIWGSRSVSVATVATTVILFLFGEMLPKCFARSCNERFAMAISASLMFLMKLLKPLSALFTALSRAIVKPFSRHTGEQVTVTEDELHDLVDSISNDDEFDENTGRLVKSALEFSASTAAEIMVPWDEVLKIRTSMKTPEILDVIRGSVHSRIPVIGRGGEIKGILQIRRYLKAYIKSGHVVLASVIDFPYYVKPDVKIDDLLTQMSNHRRNLAIVKNADGCVLGILTIEDILEQLVGEIYDEDDIGGAVYG